METGTALVGVQSEETDGDVMNQLEVNLCRVEIAEPRAAIKSRRTNRGKEVRQRGTRTCAASDWESEAALF